MKEKGERRREERRGEKREKELSQVDAIVTADCF